VDLVMEWVDCLVLFHEDFPVSFGFGDVAKGLPKAQAKHGNPNGRTCLFNGNVFVIFIEDFPVSYGFGDVVD